MTNEEIVEQIHQGVNVQDNMGLLYSQNESFIMNIVKPLSAYAELEDLMQEAFFGLQDAVEHYDSSVGTRFTTYATFRIKKHCIRYIENYGNTKRLPVYMLQRLNNYEKLLKEYGGFVDAEVVMKALDLTKKQYEELLLIKHTKDCVSIDTTVQTKEADNLTLGDTIADDSDIEESVMDSVMCEELWKQVDTLHDNLKEVIVKRYKEEQQVKDIAECLGVTTGRIHNLEKKALKRLHNLQSVQRIAEQYDYDCGLAYSSGLGRMKDGKGSNVEYLVLKKMEYEERIQKKTEQLEDTLSILAVNQQSYIIDRINELCFDKDVSIKTMEKEAGLGSGSVTKWKNGFKPRKSSLQKVADYFGVSLSFLTGNSQPTANKRRKNP